jgi:serralysin
LTANGGAGIDVIVNSGTGVDTLIGGAGNDVFEYATSAAFIAASGSADAVIDSITGGDGTTDVIKITGAIGIGAAGADTLARVVSVEKLAAAANADGSNNYAHAITLASDAAMGSVRTIDLSLDVDTDATSAITLTGVTVATTIKSAAAGASTIVGTSAADNITGGTKIDDITGGGGADTIDVGVDAVIDIVTFTATGDFGDTITNFDIGTGTGKDDLGAATALGDASGAVTFRTAVAFNTDQATTLTALTSDAGNDGNYIVELTGSTIDATLLDAIDVALAAGSAATGKTFILMDNGTNSALLYDADSSDAAVDVVLVCTLAAVADITSGTDLVLA